MNQSASPQPSAELMRRIPWPRLAIWALFFSALYLIRDFFFVIFMTFVFCYVIRLLVVRFTRWFRLERAGPWFERSAVLAVFVVLLGLLVVGAHVVGSMVTTEAHELAGKLGRFDPEHELHVFLDRTVGAMLFRQKFGGSRDDRFQKGLKAFEAHGSPAYAAYREFPGLEASIQGGFEYLFRLKAAHRIRTDRVRSPSTGSGPEKSGPTPTTRNQSKPSTTDIPRLEPGDTDQPRAGVLDLVSTTPGYTIHKARADAEVKQRLDDLASVPGYTTELHAYYDHRRQDNPGGIPYNFDTYTRLREAYPRGLDAFEAMLTQARAATLAMPGGPEKDADRNADMQASFVATEKDALVRHWWTESKAAIFVRENLTTHLGEVYPTLVEGLKRAVGFAFTVPIQIGTALLLSFFIMIDFVSLRRKAHGLRESRLAPFYHEIAPALAAFTRLIGRFFSAQAVIALCNAALTFLALTLLGVTHAWVLGALVFAASFIPVVGVLLSGVPMVVVAIMQPGGSIVLALEVILAIAFIHLFEASVLNPRIVGSMLHLHPVIVLVVLFLGEHFFGVWGLLLGVPVAVYVISHVVLGKEIPGVNPPPATETPTSAGSQQPPA